MIISDGFHFADIKYDGIDDYFDLPCQGLDFKQCFWLY
jgi:hypothetical protein